MNVSQHLLISGRVQGVGYRKFVKTRADELNISGWVRNLDDGRVEALAQGEASAIAMLTSSLRRGPLGAKVEDIKIVTISLKETLEEFQIKGNSGVSWSHAN